MFQGHVVLRGCRASGYSKNQSPDLLFWSRWHLVALAPDHVFSSKVDESGDKKARQVLSENEEEMLQVCVEGLVKEQVKGRIDLKR